MASQQWILFVPGTAGTSLWEAPFGPGSPASIHRLWINKLRLALGAWQQLTLAIPDPPPPGLPLNLGVWVEDYYTPFLQRLGARGWAIDGFFEDWRQSVLANGVDLAQKILMMHQTYGVPINVIAHSRGGLLVRWALGTLQQEGQLGAVGRVVGLGVPQWGTWCGPGLLAGWAQPAIGILQLIADLVTGINTGEVAPQVLDVVATWYTGYELCPSPSAPGLPIDQAVGLYTASAWDPALRSLSQSLMTQAKGAWATIPAPPANVPLLSVIGFGLDTPTGWREGTAFGPQANALYSSDGDNTVPAAWAHYGSEAQLFTPTNHAGLVQDGRVIDFVDGWLRGANPNGGTITGPPLVTCPY